MTTTKIFLTGASGYIGGSVLHALLNSHNASKYEVSALVRFEEHVKSVEALGVRVVKSSLDHLDILERESSNADIVVHTASSQHLAAAKSIAAGVALRKSEGKPAYLIHTSGTSIVADRANGQYLAEDVYADTDDIYTVEKSDASYNMRAVDTTLVETGEKGGFGVAIIAPPTIYGPGTGPIKRTPHQVRMLILAAIQSRQTKYVGAGLSAWTHVHIDDLASLYVLLIDSVRKGEATSEKDGYFFAETGEHTWKQLSEIIASVLHAKGLVDSPQAVPFESDSQAADALTSGSTEFSNIAFGSNSRVRAVRGRQLLGWKPRHNNEHFFNTVEEQADFVIDQDKPLGHK